MATVDLIKQLAQFFLLSLSWTLVLFSPIANSKLTGNGFIKLLSNTAIASLVLSIVIQVFTQTQFFSINLALELLCLVALIIMTTFHKDNKSMLMWVLYGIICSVLLYLILHLVQFQIAASLFLVSGSLLLGAITYSMILGHWYLVVPKLSERPLKIAAIVTWIVLFIKIIWSGYSLYEHFEFFEEQTLLGSGYAFNWMLLLMRVSFGYLVIAGMSYFNWKLLKLRSIQSSTGILYAMTFFVFIGELVSMYMFLNYGLFI